MRCLPSDSTHGRQRDSSNGHPSKNYPLLALLNFSDLMGTGYYLAMRYYEVLQRNATTQACKSGTMFEVIM